MKCPRTTLTAVLAGLAFPLLALAASPPQAAAPTVRIQMTARKYTFKPGVITVKQGDHVELLITAVDHDHGIAIPAFGVNRHLMKGLPTTVSFIASKTGTFSFHCSVFCGLGHRHMKGKLIVKPD
jgi:cytochrome c oxidase subunit II